MKKTKEFNMKYFVFSRDKNHIQDYEDDNWLFHGEYSTKEEAEKEMEIIADGVDYEHIVIKGNALKIREYVPVITHYEIEEKD